MQKREEFEIEALIFGIIGVLVFPIEGYTMHTKEQYNAQAITQLYNNTDDTKLRNDIKEKLHISEEEVNNALPYIPHRFEEFETMWNLLPQLKQEFKLGVINNANNIAQKFWEDSFNFALFDTYTKSATEGVKMPETSLYTLTAKRLMVNSSKCLFMDSNQENVQGATKAGMRGIWWKNKEDGYAQFIEYLEEIMEQREEVGESANS